MLNENDRTYFERREIYERRLAEEATDVSARKIHSEMAARYAAKLQGLPGCEPINDRYRHGR